MSLLGNTSYLGDDMYVGEILILDTVKKLRKHHARLIHPDATKIIGSLLAHPYDLLYGTLFAARVLAIQRDVSEYRLSWLFFMSEDSRNFLTACDVNNINPGYVRRMLKKECGLPFSSRLLAEACDEYAKNLAIYA